MEILSILLHYFARTWFVSENFLSLHLLLSVNRIIHSKVNPKGTLQLIYKYTITTIRYYDSHHNKKKRLQRNPTDNRLTVAVKASKCLDSAPLLGAAFHLLRCQVHSHGGFTWRFLILFQWSSFIHDVPFLPG